MIRSLGISYHWVFPVCPGSPSERLGASPARRCSIGCVSRPLLGNYRSGRRVWTRNSGPSDGRGFPG